jgi:hypothetical protein
MEIKNLKTDFLETLKNLERNPTIKLQIKKNI